MKKNEVFYAVIIIIVIVIAVFFAPKGNMFGLFKSSGGLSLKNLNQKDTTIVSVRFSLEANQTTQQNLEQALVFANYLKQKRGFYFGAGIISTVSTAFGVCCPVLFVNAGVDFNKFKLEYQTGNFARNGIITSAIDPQYSNFCLGMGEFASVQNAMQLALIKGKTKIGLGHHGGANFYELQGGNWYTFIETPINEMFFISGGVDLGEKVTGHAAAKLLQDNNLLTLTANELGTDDKNMILTYSRKNISVLGRVVMVSASVWAKNKEQGLHLVTGVKKGKGTFFAELGSNLCENQITPYVGLGMSLTF